MRTHTNRIVDAFVRDRCHGTTRRISVTLTGGEADSWSNVPVTDPAGRFIAYTSAATNLVPGSTNGFHHAYLYDAYWGVTTERIDTAFGHDDPSQRGYGWNAGDGRIPRRSHQRRRTLRRVFVAGLPITDRITLAYVSDATNILRGDTNGASDVFLRVVTVPQASTQ